MIQIIHMVLKNKLIKNISLPPLYLPHMSPTDFYHLALKIRLGNISGENVRRLWICFGGMAEKTILQHL